MFLKTLKIISICTFCILATVSLFSANLSTFAQTANSNYSVNPSLNSNSSSNQEPKLNTKSKSDLVKILKNLKDKDPQKLESKTLEKKSEKSKRENNRNFQNKSNSEKKDDENTLVSTQNNLTIETELKTKKIKVKNTDKGHISLNLPSNNNLSNQIDSVDIVDNKIIYSGKNSPVDTIVESIDGGVRQVINIKDSSAPSFYDFKIDLEVGDTLELTLEGAAIVKSSKTYPDTKESIVKTFIAKPWAKDANGKDLTTSYSIVNGNTLRQIIDLKGASFPVVADPTWCGNTVEWTTWIKRNNVWSASIRPTWCGYWGGQAWNSWQEAYNRINKCALWSGWTCLAIGWDKSTNYWSMYNQYACHVDFVRGTKVVLGDPNWNIEPSKPDKGYWGFANFSDKCN